MRWCWTRLDSGTLQLVTLASTFEALRLPNQEQDLQRFASAGNTEEDIPRRKRQAQGV